MHFEQNGPGAFNFGRVMLQCLVTTSQDCSLGLLHAHMSPQSGIGRRGEVDSVAPDVSCPSSPLDKRLHWTLSFSALDRFLAGVVSVYSVLQPSLRLLSRSCILVSHESLFCKLPVCTNETQMIRASLTKIPLHN